MTSVSADNSRFILQLRRHNNWRRLRGAVVLIVGVFLLGVVIWKLASFPDVSMLHSSGPVVLGWSFPAIVGMVIGVQASVGLVVVSAGLTLLLTRDRTAELLIRLWDERQPAPNHTMNPTP